MEGIEKSVRDFIRAAEKITDLAKVFSIEYYPPGERLVAQLSLETFYKIPGKPVLEDFAGGRLESKAQLHKTIGGMRFFCLLKAHEVQDYLPWRGGKCEF